MNRPLYTFFMLLLCTFSVSLTECHFLEISITVNVPTNILNPDYSDVFLIHASTILLGTSCKP